MEEYSYTKWIIYTLLIWIVPLIFNGLILYIHSIIFSGFWFYVLLPLNLFVNLIAFLSMKIIFAYLLIKFYGYPKEGEYKYPSKDLDAWMANVILQSQFFSIINFFDIPPHSILYFLRKAFKARLGKLKLLSHTVLNEIHLIEIGDGSIIGYKSLISAHYIEGDKIIFKRVKIGKNCTIGGYAIISPGVIIGDNTIVGAHSFVPKNKRLDKNSVYAGVPVRKIKTLKGNS